jgi:hypothetical protein
MLGFKAFDAAPATMVGIALMHMLRKDRWLTGPLAADQFYFLTA